MRANRISACVFAVAASLAGCAGGSSGEVVYSGQVTVTSPELIEIDPGVMVVADAEEPLFYSEGNYWLYRDGYWLRSDDYRRGFVRVELTYVPQRVRVIERPQTYVQYRRHHRGEYSARAPQQPVRSRPAPTGYPTRPTPTPPIAAPGDVHGNPMPPRQVPPVNVDRPYVAPEPDRPNHGNRPATPPGQAGRPGPQPVPPTPTPPPQARPEDRGNDRGNRPEDRGNGNTKGHDDHAKGHDDHDDKNKNKNKK